MQKRIRQIFLLAMDIGLLTISYILAFMIRFEFNVDSAIFENSFFSVLISHLIIILLIKVIVFKILNMYDSLWKYASIEEVFQIVMSVILGTALTALYMNLIGAFLPRSIYVITIFIDIFFVGSLRFSYRAMRRIRDMELGSSAISKNVLLVGAGDAGVVIVKEIKNNPRMGINIVGFIDDDKFKHGRRVSGVKVLGSRHDIEKIVEKKKVEEIIIAIPSAGKKDIRELLDICNKTDCKLKTLPSISEIIDGKVTFNEIRNVKIEDLLGRDIVDLDNREIYSFINSKIVLVTGGGGSIGSELCRQIAKYDPKQLLILDIYENTSYELQLELQRLYPRLDLKVLIASVRDYDRIDNIFSEFKPEIVFHAAAHKHVPLMEDSPFEAIKNNVFGTKNVVDIADANGVQKFVLISTDKAVNPTNIMGCTKRIAELIIQTKNQRSKTEYVAVRFGNVLGSNGSVIPLFKKQIESGGPVTVTHEDVTRFFMTIPEATQLVIQAGAMANGGEIFILDMGEAVKIMDLAKNLIKLSGLKPYEDIDIEIVGLRPGEKLYEELLLSEEGVDFTSHKKIFVAKPYFGDVNEFMNLVEHLKSIIDKVDKQELIKILKIAVPTLNSEFEVADKRKIV